jgi:DNA polymerase alpha subunit A
MTTTPEAVSALLNLNSPFLANMTKLVDKYLVQCGRRWVDLKSLFSFMNV